MNIMKDILGALKPSASERRVLANGIIDVPDARFKEIAAVHQDGTCFVAEGSYAHDDMDAVFMRNPAGCDACHRETSEIGRLAWRRYQREIAVGEVIEPDAEYLRCVRVQDSIGALNHWLKLCSEGGMGGITVAQKMTELVIAGRVDPRDGVRKHGDLSERMSAIQKAELKWGDAK